MAVSVPVVDGGRMLGDNGRDNRYHFCRGGNNANDGAHHDHD
jgi:hypothetical protein